MKKIKLGKKLELNKKTISDLQNGETKKVKGGTWSINPETCRLSCAICYD